MTEAIRLSSYWFLIGSKQYLRTQVRSFTLLLLSFREGTVWAVWRGRRGQFVRLEYVEVVNYRHSCVWMKCKRYERAAYRTPDMSVAPPGFSSGSSSSASLSSVLAMPMPDPRSQLKCKDALPPSDLRLVSVAPLSKITFIG